MKCKILGLLSSVLFTASVLAHGGVELGPNGGRILEFSKNGSLHAEVTLVEGNFRVALLDKDLKPVPLKKQVLVVTGGDRQKPEKPKVEKQGNQFVFAALKGTEYPLVFQFKDSPDAKTVTARMTYDASICSGCKEPEWICACDAKKGK